MPIVHILTNEPEPEYTVLSFVEGASCRAKKPWPEGAYCSLSLDNIVLYETHHGLCLSQYEKNGYDDSDFFMRVWNPETKEPHDICYATTRGWTYPAMASAVDATPEVQEEYREWVLERSKAAEMEHRRKRVLAKLQLRDLEKTVSKKLGIPRKHCIRARKPFKHGYCVKLYKLLLSNRISSRFKLSVRDQATAWLKDPNPPYPTPLSDRQKVYL